MALEERLNGLGEGVRSRLVETALSKIILPRDYIRTRYLKEDVVPEIVARLESDGLDLDSVGGNRQFREALYGSINKEPLKRTYYGMFNAKSIPTEVMQNLTPWMAIYFYAGFWAKKSTRMPNKKFFDRNTKSLNTYRIVRDCIKEGMNTIKRIHNQMYEKREYKYLLKTVPHEKEIMSLLPPPAEPIYSTQKTFFPQWGPCKE